MVFCLIMNRLIEVNLVTRKITKAVGRIATQSKLTLGTPMLQEIGGFRDYVEGMWMMLQHEKPDDWLLLVKPTP